MKKTYINLSIFILITGAMFLLVKLPQKNGDRTAGNEAAFMKSTANNDTAIYFIGSSRVQTSIDPKQIQTHFPNNPVANLGIANGTFLCSQLVAEHIIRQPGPKIIFIEFSQLSDNLPPGLLKLPQEIWFDTFLMHTWKNLSPEKISSLISVLNDYLILQISLGDDLKNIFGHSQNKHETGFVTSGKNKCNSISSFITFEETRHNSVDLSRPNGHKRIISELNDLARLNHARILFFLPVTFTSPAEKNIASSLYNSLESDMKIEYSESFLEKISKPEYLFDKNHLNRKGATIYSALLVPLIEKKLNNYFPISGPSRPEE